MKKTMTAIVTAASLVAISGPAFGQAASDQVKQQCRSAAENAARQIMAAKRAKRDLESAISRSSTNWAEQVAHYMVQAANRSDSITESELASLGTAYCVERRPTDSR
jgi:hypothetical protein